MIIEELVARLGFAVEGLDRLRRAAEMFKRLTRAIAAFAATIAARLGRVALILARVTGGLVRFGAGFIGRSALITAAATAASAALAKMAAGFAKARQATIDSARVGGVPIKEMALLENLMRRVGASAEDARKWVGDFAGKVREGAKDGGDWAEALQKQGIRLTKGKKQVKDYGAVLDDVLKAADKIKDPEKKRDFLTTALEGAPDQLVSQLLGATSAYEKFKQIVTETRKLGGGMSGGDILNAEDITTSVNRITTAVQGMMNAFGSGLMASFSQDFRKFGEWLNSLDLEGMRAKLRSFGGALGDFAKSVAQGGFTVLKEVAEVIGSLVDALARVDESSGGKLKAIAVGLGALGAALAVMAGGPAMVVAGTITALLYGIAKLQDWRSGAETPLNGFFDAIAAGAEKAKAAVDGLIETLKTMFTFGGGGTPEDVKNAQDSATKTEQGTAQRVERQRQTREEGRRQVEQETANTPNLLNWMKSLFQASEQMSPERATAKIASDKAATSNDNRTISDVGNDKRTISVSISQTVAGGEAAAAGAKRGVLGAISSKAANISTSALSAP